MDKVPDLSILSAMPPAFSLASWNNDLDFCNFAFLASNFLLIESWASNSPNSASKSSFCLSVNFPAKISRLASNLALLKAICCDVLAAAISS